MKRGFTLIEAMVAMSLLTVAFFTVLAFLEVNLRHSTQSRNQALATIQMENLMEEVRDHPYGQPAPSHWTDGKQEVRVIIDGRKVKTVLSYAVEVESEKGNGSFFDGSKNDVSDHLALTVRWHQPTGPDGQFEERERVTKLTVWRDKDVFGIEKKT
jgi:prepilin-type N-terminal cleavage/methylation domain-containing protein